MRKLFFVISVFLLAGCGEEPASLDSGIITSDIDLFLEAQAVIANGTDPVIAFQDYIDKGSPGLQDFIENRIISAEKLAEKVEQSPEVYDKIAGIKATLPETLAHIEESFEKMRELYPPTVTPDIYFLVGRRNSGGTASDNGLMIGVEVFANRPEIFSYIVSHEMVHFLQNHPSLDAEVTLLGQSIKEGAGDLIGEIISGGIINDEAHAYGMPNECQLWGEFQETMEGSDLSGWLYGKPEGMAERWDERPNDLGYFMGYRISQSYYENADDKKAAVATILNIDDFEDFLERSGYPATMKNCEDK